MSYLIETSAGDILGHEAGSLAEAVEEAKRLLNDDPEQGELTVAFYEVQRTVTFGPSANWDSVVVVLKPGEKIQRPAGFPLAVTESARWDMQAQAEYDHQIFDQEDMTGGIALDDPKSAGYHDRMSAIWDERDK